MEKLLDAIKWLRENTPPNKLTLKDHIYYDLGEDGVVYKCEWDKKRPSTQPVRTPFGKLPDGWDIVQVPGEIPYPFEEQDGYLLPFIGPKYTCDYVRSVVAEYQTAAAILRDLIDV